jgi:1-phosphofructokinase
VADPSDSSADICVFAPNLMATVTVERGPQGDEIHFHAGGQGFWVARVIQALGGRPVICAPVGAEAGEVVRALVAGAGLELAEVPVSSGSPAYVHDRRDGERVEVASALASGMSRHELDELYGITFANAMAAGIVVLTGTAAGWDLPPHFLCRLSQDLHSTGVTAVADLHGDDLDALLEGGPVDMLKLSHEDLLADEALDGDGDDDGAIALAVHELRRRGAASVVVSRSAGTSIGFVDGQWFRARGPVLEEMDHRGSGDSMTAALAVARQRGVDAEMTLRLATAAGAANVTRHGLGAQDVDLISELVNLTEAEPVPGI